MHDCADAVFGDQAHDDQRIGNIAKHEARARIDIGPHAGREVVEHDDLLARVAERKYHMAADITGAARDQNCHRRPVLSSLFDRRITGAGFVPVKRQG